MNRIRVASAALLCVSLLTLTACGEKEDASNSAGSAPSISAAPSSAAAPAPSSSAAADPTTGGKSDKELCESAKKAGQEMKDAYLATFKSGGELSTADLKKVLTQLEAKLTTLVAAGGDSKVAAALKNLSAETAKTAAAADPESAPNASAFEKAGKELTAACKAAGVPAAF